MDLDTDGTILYYAFFKQMNGWLDTYPILGQFRIIVPQRFIRFIFIVIVTEHCIVLILLMIGL